MAGKQQSKKGTYYSLILSHQSTSGWTKWAETGKKNGIHQMWNGKCIFLKRKIIGPKSDQNSFLSPQEHSEGTTIHKLKWELIHAFISSRLDYCDALFAGLPKKTTERLQLIQNSAARLLIETKRREHISPVLASLLASLASLALLASLASCYLRNWL